MGDDLEKPLMAGAEANKEKEHVTLPPWSNADLTDVVLYEGKASPPCCTFASGRPLLAAPAPPAPGPRPHRGIRTNQMLSCWTSARAEARARNGSFLAV